MNETKSMLNNIKTAANEKRVMNKTIWLLLNTKMAANKFKMAATKKTRCLPVEFYCLFL